MSELQITSEFITLAQAVKLAGLAGTGGQAKYLVRVGEVAVNGIACTQPGKKLMPGDRFSHGTEEWTIQAR
ncbi:MAG: RNA-binding S4 domain-containing protein [Gemmataceae bacterium]